MAIANRFLPPLDYLQAASRTSLQSFEMARLNHAANLRREISALIDQWIHETSEATLARYLLDHHESIHGVPKAPKEPLAALLESAADPLPDLADPSNRLARAPRFADGRLPVTEPIGRKVQKRSISAP